VNKTIFFPTLYIKGRAVRFENSTYGFELKPYHLERQHLNLKKWMVKLDRNGWKIIHLQRRNVFLQAISFLIAKQRNQWKDRLDNPLKGSKFYINSDKLIKEIQKRESCLVRENKALEQLHYITITYEDDLLKAEQHQKTAERVFEYLGVDSVSVKTKYKRTTSDNMSDFIENYEEIVSVISQTKYEKFMDD